MKLIITCLDRVQHFVPEAPQLAGATTFGKMVSYFVVAIRTKVGAAKWIPSIPKVGYRAKLALAALVVAAQSPVEPDRRGSGALGG